MKKSSLEEMYMKEASSGIFCFLFSPSNKNIYDLTFLFIFKSPLLPLRLMLVLFKSKGNKLENWR